MDKTNYVGIINGLKTWEVINEATGEIIGHNQTMPDEEV